jgi:hypothetical protein
MALAYRHSREKIPYLGFGAPLFERRAAHAFAVHVATQRGLAERRQYRHPPCTQPVAPMRERHCRRPRLTPEVLHRSGTLWR